MKHWLAAFALVFCPLVLSGCAKPQAPATLEAKYTSPTSQFINLADGTRLHIRDEGKKDGRTVVLVHGSNASLQAWEPWVARLGKDYRLISLDLPGHGLTGATPAKDYSVERYVSVVDELTTKLGVKEFSIAGNSMGGGVAWRYALAHPTRVQALILVDAGGYPYEDTGFNIFTLVRMPVIGEIMSGFASPDLFRSNLKATFVDQSKVTDKMVTQYFELNTREGTPAATLARLRGKSANPDAWKQIKTITTPTLILWGAKDALIPVAVADRFAADLPVSEKIIYPNVGHLPMEEIPDQSAADAGAFLDAVIGRDMPTKPLPR